MLLYHCSEFGRSLRFCLHGYSRQIMDEPLSSQETFTSILQLSFVAVTFICFSFIVWKIFNKKPGLSLSFRGQHHNRGLLDIKGIIRDFLLIS